MTDHPTTERMPTGSPDVVFDDRPAYRPPLEPPELQALREAWSEMATRLWATIMSRETTIRRLEAQVDDLRQRLMQARGAP